MMGVAHTDIVEIGLVILQQKDVVAKQTVGTEEQCVEKNLL
jgi:hypothetical protein